MTETGNLALEVTRWRKLGGERRSGAEKNQEGYGGSETGERRHRAERRSRIGGKAAGCMNVPDTACPCPAGRLMHTLRSSPPLVWRARGSPRGAPCRRSP